MTEINQSETQIPAAGAALARAKLELGSCKANIARSEQELKEFEGRPTTCFGILLRHLQKNRRPTLADIHDLAALASEIDEMMIDIFMRSLTGARFFTSPDKVSSAP